MSETDARGRLLLETSAGPLLVALPLIGRVEPIGEIVPVPGAPTGVAGLAELRGRPVTLLEPTLWLDGDHPADGADQEADPRMMLCGLQLAPPHDHLALILRGKTAIKPDNPGDDELPRLDGQALNEQLARLAASRRGEP